MPRGAIIYFSTTGNTKLACEYLSNRIPQIDFDLIDILDLKGVDLTVYESVGFATYCDFQGPPLLMLSSIGSLPKTNGKPSFILITYAAIHGHTMLAMRNAIEERGYRVLSGHAMRMPENYSPLRKKGMKGDEKPDAKDLEGFQNYIRALSDLLVAHHLGKNVDKSRIRIGFFNTFFRGKDRYKAKKEMGPKKVDLGLCTKCGMCERSCPYNAVKLDPTPKFDEDLCMGCFSCYNLCPIGAISTSKLTNEYRYPGPSEDLKKRMSY